MLSKDAMKKAQVHIDFENDAISFFNKSVKIYFSNSGHYCININDKTDQNSNNINIQFFCKSIENANVAEKKKIALKLHRQFGHPLVIG